MNKLEQLLMEVRLQQYKINNAKTRDFVKVYKRERIELQKKLMAELANYTEDLTETERMIFMAKFKPEIIKSVKSIGEWESYEMPKRLADVYGETFFNSNTILESGFKKSETMLSFELLQPEMIIRAVNTPIKDKDFSDRIWSNKEGLANSVYELINERIVDGTDTRKLARELAETYDVGTRQAMRLLQNETTRVMTQAQDDVYRASDVVEEVQFVATLDDKTSDTCQQLDGETFYKNDDSKPSIPEDTHVGCRSTYIPIVEGWSPTLRYDNLNKEQVEYMTYDKWKEQH